MKPEAGQGMIFWGFSVPNRELTKAAVSIKANYGSSVLSYHVIFQQFL